MDRFVLQPGVYSTSGEQTLYDVLDKMWFDPANESYSGGSYYLVSGFGTHNGGLAFYERFRHHVERGGQVVAVLAGSRSMNLASRQLAAALLHSGVEVRVVNRRHILHAKLYGTRTPSGEEQLVVTSGNFTTPGTKLNVEAVVTLGPATVDAMGFSWAALLDSLDGSGVEVLQLTDNQADPVWSLLYDEGSRRPARVGVDEEDEVEDAFGSMVVTLSHADTARIQAQPGTNARLGSQYFWLSKDSHDFFPPLTIRNKRGAKATYSAKISVVFAGLQQTKDVRVTFEAENNMDFRLGTGPLRGTQTAADGDMAVLIRRADARYELHLVRQGTPKFIALNRYALTNVGNRGKRAGFAPTAEVERVLGITPSDAGQQRTRRRRRS